MKASTQTFAAQTPRPYNLSQGVAYALPVLATSFLISSMPILQGIYVKHFGLPLTTIAMVILTARLFDAAIDPVIGYMSDRYYARTGSRKPFVIGGGLLLILSSYFLYIPPVSVSAEYFLGWFIAFFIAWTLFEIPHLAWGGELSADSQDKSKIYSLRALAIYLGGMLFFVLPLLPFFETNEFTPQTLTWSVLAAGLLMLPLLYISAKAAPDGCFHQPSTQPVQQDKKQQRSFRNLLSIVFGNKPFLLFAIAFFFMGAGAGMWVSLKFFFVDAYLGLGDKLALIFLISYIANILAVGGWYKLAAHLSKKGNWYLAMSMTLAGVIGSGLLIPGEGSWIPLLLIMIAVHIGSAGIVVLAPSLLADIIDYGTWKLGQDHSGTYFSFYTLIIKGNAALGSALGLAVAGWYGFDASATTHTDDNVFGLRLSMVWIPMFLLLLSMVFIVVIPIDARRHAIIRNRLDARAARAKAQTVQTPQSRELFTPEEPLNAKP